MTHYYYFNKKKNNNNYNVVFVFIFFSFLYHSPYSVINNYLIFVSVSGVCLCLDFTFFALPACSVDGK